MTVRQIGKSALKRVRSIDTAAPVEYTLRFVMGFLLSRARIFRDFAPFGVAFAVSCPCGAQGYAAAAGAILGAFTGGVSMGIKYTAAVVLIRVILEVFSDTSAGGLMIFAPIVTFGTMACIGGVYAMQTGWNPTAVILYVVETFLAAGCVLFYGVALAPWSDSGSGAYGKTCHYISVTLLVSTLAMSLADISILGILSIGRFAATVIIMFVLYRGGAGSGCIIAVAMGAAMDLNFGATPYFITCYCLSAIISGVFTKNGRLIFLLSYVIGTAICVIWSWGYMAMLPALYETFAASVIFALLPDSVLAKAGTVLPSSGSGSGFMMAREYVRDRVELTAKAFEEFTVAIKQTVSEHEESVSTIFDRASDMVCCSCGNCEHCWTHDYGTTLNVMNNITPVLMKNGSVSVSDLPKSFAERCSKVGELTAAINMETRTYLCRRQYHSRLSENRGAVCNQYSDISEVLENLAEELGRDITIEPSMERRLKKYLRGLGIPSSVAVFRVRGGRLRAELHSTSINELMRDPEYLNKLSELLGTRLCTRSENPDDDRLILLEAEPLSVKIGIAGRRKTGESVSGDKGTYFRTDEGYIYVLLSDGMGSGENAAKFSSRVIDGLERFLKAGVKPETALRIVANMSFFKNEDDIESATVDMLCLNMFSGDAKLFKYGAAPSYLKKGDVVKRISQRGNSLPIGFSTSSGAHTDLKLSSGSSVVIVSDGVTGGASDKWLKKLVSEAGNSDDPKILAKSILDTRLKIAGGEDCEEASAEDDMTVLVVQISERE